MTVPPVNQLTMRMVPASTLRRMLDTMAGTTMRTNPTAIAPMIRGVVMRPCMCDSDSRKSRELLDDRYRARLTSRVYIVDAKSLPSANARAEQAVLWLKRGQDLHHLSVQLQRNDALAVLVERAHGDRFVGDGRLERLRRTGSETHREVPDRGHNDSLEHDRADGRRGEQYRARKHGVQHRARRAKAQHEAEQESRRRDEPERATGEATALRMTGPRRRSGMRMSVGDAVRVASTMDMTAAARR